VNVLSVSMRTEHSGVSNYARQLESKLAALGAGVTATGYREALGAVWKQRFDRVFVQHELPTSIRSGELLAVFALLFATRATQTPTVVIEHTILTREFLRSQSLFLGTLYYPIQRCLLYAIARLAPMTVLTPGARAWLADRGIDARSVPIGIYEPPAAAARETCATSPSVARLERERRCVIGILGFHYGFKRYDLAIRAFALLPPSVRGRALLATVGGKGDVKLSGSAAVRDALGSLGEEEYLSTGALDEADFVRAVAACDVVLLPYVRMLSASSIVSWIASLGVPAIVSDSPVFDELVTAGGAIRVADWPSGAALALSRVIEDASYRRQLRARLAELCASNGIAEAAKTLLAT
jgi:glycosyltransferase involved in cell wall biosynthesis